MKILNRTMVDHLLPMSECITAVEHGMVAASAKRLGLPQRMSAHGHAADASLLLMPVFGQSNDLDCVKLATIRRHNQNLGLPTIQGLVLLFDQTNGRPLAVIDAALLTERRTAAASAVATRALYSARHSQHPVRVGILGTGVQASAHIEAIAAIVPIEEVVVWGRNSDKALALADHESRRLSFPVRTGSAKEAAACDIVNAVTSASSPILFNDWIKHGAHVNLVGSHTPDAREADGLLMARNVYVDWMPSALSEAGDVLQAIAENHLAPDDLIELGQVLNGDHNVPSDPLAVTVYKSVGFGAQDLYAAQHIYRRAMELGVGIDADWPFE